MPTPIINAQLDAIRVAIENISPHVDPEEIYAAVQDWLDAHPEATTTVADNSITYPKLNSALKIGITCSALGMTENDADGENMTILKNAINSGKPILVDGKYHISPNSDVISSNINMESLGSDYGFVFDASGQMFVIDGDISINIRGVVFTQNASSGLATVFAGDASSRIEAFVVDCCIFNRTNTGSIRFLDFRIGNAYPDVNTVGINTLLFTNNTVIENQAIFCVITNAPVRYAYISGNTVENMYSEVFHVDVENAATYKEEAKLSREHFYVSNNFVKNDDSYWSMDRDANYVCFILLEGYRLDFVNNHIEGIHSEADCGLYDAYPATFYYFSYDNAWVDNAVFSDAVSYTTFMKLKGIEKKAVVSNNVYAISDDYAERVGKDGYEIKTMIYDIFDSNPEVIISDNSIIAQTLLPPSLHSLDINDFYYKNNIVRAKKWNGGSFYPCEGGKANIFDFSNNIFRFEETGSGGFYLIYGSSFTGLDKAMSDIKIKGNLVSFGANNATVNTSFIQSLIAENCNVVDLDVLEDSNANGKINRLTSIECVFINGLITSEVYFKSVLPNLFAQNNSYTPRYNKDVTINSEYLSAVGNIVIASWAEDALPSGVSSCLYDYDIDIITPTYVENHKFVYVRYLSEGVMKYKGIAANGTTLFDVSQTDTRQDLNLATGNNVIFNARIYANTTEKLDGMSWSYKGGGMPAGTVIKIHQRTVSA